MTPEILGAVISFTSKYVTLWTVLGLLIEFYTFLRLQEVSEITLQDITFDEGCIINIKRSKTDQHGVGAIT